jgi:hypothetical protein
LALQLKGENMSISKQLEERIAFYIERLFCYLEYPDGVTEGFWKDANGSYISIEDMDMDYLKNCIRRIEKNLEQYDSQKIKDQNHQLIRGILFPLAEKKLIELRAEFQRQANEI